MKRTIAFVLVLFFGVISAFAQGEKWKILSPPDEEFAVEFPTEKFEEEKTNSEGKFVSGAYRAISEKTYFFIFSGNDERALPLGAVTKFAEENKADGGKFGIGNFFYKGKKYVFKDSEDFYHSLITLKLEKRFYIFHAVSEYKDSEMVEKFLDSIQIKKIDQPKTPTSETAVKSEEQKPKETEKAVDKTERVAVPTGGIGSGLGSGSGSGGGVGGGVSSPTPTPIKPGQTSPTKILAKQQAKYSDLARVYGMTGQVTLKVTFLADGTIGNITPVSRLPFGLTTTAIAAAKTIRFEPAVRNGVPYNVVKIVAFTFMIY